MLFIFSYAVLLMANWPCARFNCPLNKAYRKTSERKISVKSEKWSVEIPHLSCVFRKHELRRALFCFDYIYLVCFRCWKERTKAYLSNRGSAMLLHDFIQSNSIISHYYSCLTNIRCDYAVSSNHYRLTPQKRGKYSLAIFRTYASGKWAKTLGISNTC